MSIDQKPFVRYHEKKEVDTFTVKLNAQERQRLEDCKYILQQEKDSTAIKQLADIGAQVLLEKKVKVVLGVVLNNYRRNKRQGIITFE